MKVFGALPTSYDVCDVTTFLWAGILFRWRWQISLYDIYMDVIWQIYMTGMKCQVYTLVIVIQIWASLFLILVITCYNISTYMMPASGSIIIS